jgi:hypothetical protein
LVWSHCPYPLRLPTASQPATETEVSKFPRVILDGLHQVVLMLLAYLRQKLRGIIEKKTFINLIEGFAVSLKHYLRGGKCQYLFDCYFLV